MAEYKLTYFNGRGLGEIIRLIFTAADVPFEDVRITHDDKWPEVKATLSPPMGQLPILETGGLKLFQSLSICRYLARKFGLAGKTDVDQCKADSIVDSIEDMNRPVYQFWVIEKDEAKKAALKKTYIEETLPNFLSKFENLLKANHNGDGYFVGDGLTWADIHFMVFYDRLTLPGVGVDFPSDKFPKLKALVDRVSGHPKIAAYLAKRPKSEF